MNLHIWRGLTAYGTIDWKTVEGITDFRIDAFDGDSDPYYHVQSADDGGDEIAFEGEFSVIESDIKEDPDLDEATKQVVLRQLRDARETMDKQHLPDVSFTSQQLILHQAEARAKRREWLIEQITKGNISCATQLKAEFGESIRLSVEIVDEAA